jgi:hypothetical protein
MDEPLAATFGPDTVQKAFIRMQFAVSILRQWRARR